MAWYNNIPLIGNAITGIQSLFNGLNAAKNVVQNGGLDNLFNRFTGNALTDADLQNWQLNEQSADNATQRQFDLWNKTQSIGAQVSQMQEAGLNPALMMQNGSVGSVPSAVMGGVANAEQFDPSGLLGAFTGAYKAPSEVFRNKTQGDENISSAARNYAEINNVYSAINRRDKLTDAELAQAWATVSNLESKTESENLKHDLLRLDIQKNEIANQFIEQGALAEIELKKALTDYHTAQISGIEQGIRESNTRVQALQQQINQQAELFPLLIIRTQQENWNAAMMNDIIEEVNWENRVLAGLRESAGLSKDIANDEALAKIIEGGYLDKLTESELQEMSANIKLKKAFTFDAYTRGAKNITESITDVVGTAVTGTSKLFDTAWKADQLTSLNPRSTMSDTMQTFLFGSH